MRRLFLALAVSACLATPAMAKEPQGSVPIMKSGFSLSATPGRVDRALLELPALRLADGSKPRPYASTTLRLSDGLLAESQVGLVSVSWSTLTKRGYHPNDVIEQGTKGVLGVGLRITGH